MKDSLFISRAGADSEAAAAIGRILECAGYSVILQQWDFANRNFIERMHAALAGGARVVALLSPEYLQTDYCAAEWQNAIAGDPLNTNSRLILLRVAECEPAGLLAGIAYWDLVPIREHPELLAEVVLDAVRTDRRQSASADPYWRAARTIFDHETIRPTPGFTGRAMQLDTLGAAFDQAQTVAVYGLGGIGKSSLAREYAWRNRERYAAVWWLNAENESGIVEGLLRLGSLFMRGLDRIADRRAAAKQVIAKLLAGFAKPVLLIFDNLEDERLVNTWRPRTPAHLLITSRDASWSGDIAAIPLDAWPVADGVRYVVRESRRTDIGERDAEAIVESLGSLPLALAHAAAYLRSTRTVTPARYLERIREQLRSAPRHAEYPQSVFATFRSTASAAEQQAAGAEALLSFAALFAPEAIPDELFRQSEDLYPEALRPVVRENALTDEALGALDRLSLLAYAEASRAYSIHRLVRLAACDTLGNEEWSWTASAVAVAEAAFPDVTFEVWPQCERLLPHALAALDAQQSGAESPPAGRLAYRCGVYLRERGEFVKAEALHRRALATFERLLRADHCEVAASSMDLGHLYLAEGRYDEAASSYTRALTVFERAYGPNHSDVAASLNSLGTLLYEQGRYHVAEPFFKRALAVWEQTLGSNDANIGRVLGNLAGVYYAQERFDDAEPLVLRALELNERALGADHPYVAVQLNNVAEIHHCRGRDAEAELLLVRALTIWEHAGYGSEHHEVAMTLNVLGTVYEAMERYEEAGAAHSRALAIREKALGPDHQSVATTLTNLASVYRRQNRFDDAEPLLERANEIREKALGVDHPDLVPSLQGLARVYETQGRSHEARGLDARAEQIQRAGRADPTRGPSFTSAARLADASGAG